MIEQSFDEACRAFGDFLAAESASRSVAWVFRDEVSCWRRRWLIDGTVATVGARPSAAAELYDQGRGRGLGVCLHAIGEAEGVTYAYVLLPIDEADQGNRMMSDTLRLSAGIGATIEVARSRAGFRLIRGWDRLRGVSPVQHEVPRRPGRVKRA